MLVDCVALTNQNRAHRDYMMLPDLCNKVVANMDVDVKGADFHALIMGAKGLMAPLGNSVMDTIMSML